MPGRNKSPVQQAWEYAIDSPGAKWVLVSNCAEIRLYAFGHGRELYETWDLGLLDDPAQHERLWLLIGAKNLLSGRTAVLLDESASAQKDITNKLYIDYKKTRDTLIQTLQDPPPRLAALTAIEHAQTILDRVLFIAFAESTALLPAKLIHDAWEKKSKFRPNGAWENFVGLFDAVDKGNQALDIPGGLFARNDIIDALGLSNFVCENFAKIADYDFSSDVPVSVLGHIFEQSVSDIEKMRAEAQGEAPPKTSKRKRDGVVYTPGFVTRFIVEETIGKTLLERFAVVLDAHGVVETKTETGPVYKWTKDVERAVWLDYQQELRSLTIVDPACGSGAFLIAAFDYLSAEYRRVAERLKALGETVDASEMDREILAGNLHGVDLNPEPVEITKLSLWLKTAKRGKLLQDLGQSIKCGNSLIADKSDHVRAFDWEAEFPEIFACGGFDIVLGNPPYVRMETIKPFKPYLKKHFAVYAGAADLYAYFFERGIRLLRPGGRLGYISSWTFFRTGFGKALRRYLRTHAEIETVIDFGDQQVFEGVTTYPVIMTMKRPDGDKPEGKRSDINFLNLKTAIPEDLSRAFRANSTAMPGSRLTDGSWQLEVNAPAALRDKIKANKPTLLQRGKRPLYGAKTGANDVFVISQHTRDRLLQDPSSASLIHPLLTGDDLCRWGAEFQERYLIFTNGIRNRAPTIITPRMAMGGSGAPNAAPPKANYGGGSYVNCSDATQPGVPAVLNYLGAKAINVKPNCDAGHYYLLNNYNPGYFGDGSNAYTDTNPANYVYTIPPSSVPTIGDELNANNISWVYYGDQWNQYLNDKYQLLYNSGQDQYCNICNWAQYSTSIMTSATARAASLKDTTDLYSAIESGNLPAVSYVKPSGLVDGHPASSKLILFEGFVKKIVDAVKANKKLFDTTAIFITFDEGGGYWDSGYVQPLDFFGDGTRIPMIVVSKYSEGGHISHTYTDHVSVAKFIEANWGLGPISSRSRDNFPNPTAGSNPYIPPNPPAIGDLMDMFVFKK
jgi:type I restriction-modification system DNA methylase subunit